jgi:predicted acyltransferase
MENSFTTNNIAELTPIAAHKRITSIDRLRGIAIFLMVIGGFIGQVKSMPWLLRHPTDPEALMTLADLVAPMFIFTIGLTFGLSYNKRKERDGKPAAVQHFLLRYFALIGFGAAMTAFENIARDAATRMDWAVFQAIGMSGLILLIFIDLPTFKRFVIGAVLIILYQFLLTYQFYDIIVTSNHAGVLGSLSWGAMLIFASCFADLFFKNKVEYLLLLAAFIVAGFITSMFFNPSKLTMSVSFTLISTSVSAGGFIAVDFISRFYKRDFDPLTWWGKNPILLYFLNGVVVEFIFGIVMPPVLWFDAPLWLAIPEAVILAILFTYLAWFLDKKKMFIKI